jgi:hypothetical protein
MKGGDYFRTTSFTGKIAGFLIVDRRSCHFRKMNGRWLPPSSEAATR